MVQRLKRSILSEPMGLSDLDFQQQLSSWTSYKWRFSILSQVLPLSGPPSNQEHLISSPANLDFQAISRRNVEGKNTGYWSTHFCFNLQPCFWEGQGMSTDCWELSGHLTFLLLPQSHVFDPVALILFPFLICHSLFFLLVFLFSCPFFQQPSEALGRSTGPIISHFSEIIGSGRVRRVILKWISLWKIILSWSCTTLEVKKHLRNHIFWQYTTFTLLYGNEFSSCFLWTYSLTS